MEEKKNRLEPVQLDSCKPLREVVLESLREAIKNEILEPGERLMEIQLADALGVSRTPIREALRKLELEGFIVMVPRKGAYVADISLKDITDIMEIRLALEELAAGLAADRITEEELEQMECSLVEKREAISQGDMERLVEVDTQFHEALYQASRNERLVAMLNNLREQIQRFRILSLSHPGRMKQSLNEHRSILEAVQEHDVMLARQLAREHIENAEQILLETFDRSN